MKINNPQNQSFNSIPKISTSCITSQLDAICRQSPNKAGDELTAMLAEENPELLKFLMESTPDLLNTEILPRPIRDLIGKRIFLHCGLVYRFIRAQIQADSMNAAWDDMGVDPESSAD